MPGFPPSGVLHTLAETQPHEVTSTSRLTKVSKMRLYIGVMDDDDWWTVVETMGKMNDDWLIMTGIIIARLWAGLSLDKQEPEIMGPENEVMMMTWYAGRRFRSLPERPEMILKMIIMMIQ